MLIIARLAQTAEKTGVHSQAGPWLEEIILATNFMVSVIPSSVGVRLIMAVA